VQSVGLVSFLCYFHFLRANERKLKSTVPDPKLRGKLLNMLRSLKKCNIEAEFRSLLQLLYDNSTESFAEYFRDEYVCGRGEHIGPYQLNPTAATTCLCAAQGWANIGSRSKFPLRERDETTNLIERFFHSFKYEFLDGRNYRRLSEVHVITIDHVIPHYLRDAMMKKSGRVVSDHQRYIDRRERDVSELLRTPMAIIFSDGDAGIGAVHSMSKKESIHSICLAEMRCTCPFAVTKSAICKHLEAAIMLIGYNAHRHISCTSVDMSGSTSTDMSGIMSTDMSTDTPAMNNGVVLLGSVATEAAANLLSNMTDSTTDYKVEANTVRVASIIQPQKLYFVDLQNRLCSCLHHQIYSYCAHVLHAAESLNDSISIALTQELMNSETANSVDIDYWRFIGRDDKQSVSDFSGVSLLNDYEVETNPNEFQPSDIGNDTTREILKRLQTMTPQDRAMINEELTVILDKCVGLQVVPLLAPKVSISHNGNRQDTDRIVKPLFPRQQKRKHKNVSTAPTLSKTKKLIHSQEQKGGGTTLIGTDMFDEYRALPGATLLENVTRRK
jgi:hypothetical protein